MKPTLTSPVPWSDSYHQGNTKPTQEKQGEMCLSHKLDPCLQTSICSKHQVRYFAIHSRYPGSKGLFSFWILTNLAPPYFSLHTHRVMWEGWTGIGLSSALLCCGSCAIFSRIEGPLGTPGHTSFLSWQAAWGSPVQFQPSARAVFRDEGGRDQRL